MFFFRWLWFMHFWKFLVYFIFIPFTLWFVFRLGYHYGSRQGIYWREIIRTPRTYFFACSPSPHSRTPVLPYFTIWMGTYRSKKMATAQKSELTKKRINAIVLRQSGSYFVIIGKYTTLEAALNQMKLLKDMGFLYARIVKPYSF